MPLTYVTMHAHENSCHESTNLQQSQRSHQKKTKWHAIFFGRHIPDVSPHDLGLHWTNAMIARLTARVRARGHGAPSGRHF